MIKEQEKKHNELVGNITKKTVDLPSNLTKVVMTERNKKLKVMSKIGQNECGKFIKYVNFTKDGEQKSLRYLLY